MSRFASIFTALAITVAASSAVYSAVPTVLHYQGVLTDGGGTPITTMTAVTFSLFNAPAAGSIKWTENRNVSPDSEGRFSILLGQATPLHDTVFKTQSLWLAVQIGVQELSPRSFVSSAAYAFRISTVDGATGGSISGNTEVLATAPGDGLGVRDPGGNIGSMTSTSASFADINNDTIAQFGDVGLRFIEPSTNDTIFNYDPNTSSLEIGIDNAVNGSQSFALGTTNTVNGSNAFAIGTGNQANHTNSFAIGSGCVASGMNSVAAGTNNVANGNNASVLAGSDNQASFLSSFVGGGDRNSAIGAWAAVVAGSDNRAGVLCFVGAGVENAALNGYSSVLGGVTDTAAGFGSAICGGYQNRTDGEASLIGAGMANRAPGFCAVIPGGHSNRAGGSLSFSAGYRAKANHKGSFVWADSTEADFASTGDNQFLIRASGGVGIGTIAPGKALQIGHGATPGSEGMIRLASREVVMAAARTWDIGVPQTGSVTTGKGYDFVVDDLGTGSDPEAVFQWGNGYLGLGVLDPSNRITLPNVASTSGQGLANAWNVYSSRRWKQNIRTIEHPLELVSKLRGVRYEWKESNKPDIGLIAEEVGAVIPDVVQYEANGVDAQSVDYARLVALLIEGMKAQQSQIDAQAREIESLKQSIAQ